MRVRCLAVEHPIKERWWRTYIWVLSSPFQKRVLLLSDWRCHWGDWEIITIAIVPFCHKTVKKSYIDGSRKDIFIYQCIWALYSRGCHYFLRARHRTRFVETQIAPVWILNSARHENPITMDWLSEYLTWPNRGTGQELCCNFDCDSYFWNGFLHLAFLLMSTTFFIILLHVKNQNFPILEFESM